MDTTIPSSTTPTSMNSNRIRDLCGAIAAGACAIHCIATPAILIFAPALAGSWVTPEVHWALAMISLPLAVWILVREAKNRRKSWISVSATLGVASLVTGLVLSGSPVRADQEPGATNSALSAESCQKSCCPSVQIDPNGEIRADIPPASGFTLAGGLFLVMAHTGRIARRRRECTTACCPPPEAP